MEIVITMLKLVFSDMPEKTVFYLSPFYKCLGSLNAVDSNALKILKIQMNLREMKAVEVRSCSEFTMNKNRKANLLSAVRNFFVYQLEHFPAYAI